MPKREAPSQRRAKQLLNEKRGKANVVYGKFRMNRYQSKEMKGEMFKGDEKKLDNS